MKTYLKKYLWYSALIPAITILLIFTNEYHHIMRSGYALEISTFYGQYLVVHSTVIGSILVGLTFYCPFLRLCFCLICAKSLSRLS
jgi:hypothetical protein